jgi:hypothetical protein
MRMLETPASVSSSAKESIEVEETLLLNVAQSAEVNKPRAEADADGSVNVWVLPEETIEKSVPLVEDAKVCEAPVWPFKDVMPLTKPKVEVETHVATDPLVCSTIPFVPREEAESRSELILRFVVVAFVVVPFVAV